MTNWCDRVAPTPGSRGATWHSRREALTGGFGGWSRRPEWLAAAAAVEVFRVEVAATPQEGRSYIDPDDLETAGTLRPTGPVHQSLVNWSLTRVMSLWSLAYASS